MVRWPRSRRALGYSLMLSLISSLLVVLGSASPAHADPVCNQAYVLFARGSGSNFDSAQANSFRIKITAALQNRGFSTIGWAELGNVDGSVNPSAGHGPDDPAHEYPAFPVNDYHVLPQFYGTSVQIGTDELVKHLNDRYAGNGPQGQGSCSRETLILGGYSQGADVVGWALQRSDLSQAAKDHIGYVALYGDPKFDPGSLGNRFFHTNFNSDWWWVRGDDWGFRPWAGGTVLPNYLTVIPYIGLVPDSGVLSPRAPYVSNEFKGRFGSWCAAFDGICGGWLPLGMDVHSNAYQGDSGWIERSAGEIAWAASNKHNQLNPDQPPVDPGVFQAPDPTRGPPITSAPSPAPPVITHVKRTTSPDGTREVFASTMSSITEGWWQPGGDGVHTDEIINIAQDNIVGFDKANMPDGVTQAVYTAVPDGVWETWWSASHSPTSAKIVTGLSGVKQVIVANAYESSQFVHRLYLLAQDGPYEVWWKDGGDGVHVDRLNNITGGVTMTAATGPDGAYEVFVATPTWVYELWWFPGGTVNNRTILNITQGDIRSLSMGANLNGGQLLYTGTSTTAWQSWWLGDNGAISNGTIATGQTNAIKVEKDVYNGVHELYLATGDHVQEYWWNDTSSGGGELIRITQNNITSFDKSDDGAYQQIYTASGNLVYETYWAAGVSPTSSVLFSVTR